MVLIFDPTNTCNTQVFGTGVSWLWGACPVGSIDRSGRMCQGVAKTEDMVHLCLFKVIFLRFYHGIHPHVSPSFGKYVFSCFSNHRTSKPKYMSDSSVYFVNTNYVKICCFLLVCLMFLDLWFGYCAQHFLIPKKSFLKIQKTTQPSTNFWVQKSCVEQRRALLYGLFGLKCCRAPRNYHQRCLTGYFMCCVSWKYIIITFPSHENVKIRKWEQKTPSESSECMKSPITKNPRINCTLANLRPTASKENPKKTRKEVMGWDLSLIPCTNSDHIIFFLFFPLSLTHETLRLLEYLWDRVPVFLNDHTML